MKIRSFARSLFALALVLCLGVAAFADVIRMKDGQVIRGEIVAFRDQQFTVLVGRGERGRRSRMTIYMEDVESIEFEGAANADAGSNTGPAGGRDEEAATRPEPVRPQPTPTPAPPRTGGDPRPSTGTSQPAAGTDSAFFPVRIRVRADNAANGWTDSGLMVRRGQRLRVSATGRVSLGQGRFSTPTGLPRVMDTEKLMRNEPTGGLIAVVGDDNDEFIFIGANREFYAPRDGRLFLGVNEGNLADNTGTFDALIEVEPVTGGGN
ncbi:MAG TPA: hypothetical protein VFS10_06955 [Pyrinomonadaceae bacterium]|nr:hypothetical protein [Pyrinomonadaceae bacterium]